MQVEKHQPAQQHSGSPRQQTMDTPGPTVSEKGGTGLSQQALEKRHEILKACEKEDLAALKIFAETEGGFLTDELRAAAWPLLLGLRNKDVVAINEEHPNLAWKWLPRHHDEEQVNLDTNRAFVYYPNDESDSEITSRKSELSDLIIGVLRTQPWLNYFQGYHDISQVLLLVLPPPLRLPLLARLSALRIRDFMLETLESTVAQLRLIPDILAIADPTLKNELASTEPFYALAGTLTMYAHNIQSYQDIARLFDVFLAREPVFSVYMFAQIVLRRRDSLLEFAYENEGDPSILQLMLSKIPADLDVEALITETTELYNRLPPEKLPAWKRISASSCLKTARSVETCAEQTLEDGKRYFDKQTAEMEAAERRRRIMKMVWSHRRSAGAMGLAVAVGLAAMYVGKSPRPMAVLAMLYSKWTGPGGWFPIFS